MKKALPLLALLLLLGASPSLAATVRVNNDCPDSGDNTCVKPANIATAITNAGPGGKVYLEDNIPTGFTVGMNDVVITGRENDRGIKITGDIVIAARNVEINNVEIAGSLTIQSTGSEALVNNVEVKGLGTGVGITVEAGAHEIDIRTSDINKWETGISVTDSGTSAEKNNILSNTIDDVVNAIVIGGTSQFTSINSNKLSGTGTGITVQDSAKNITISNNNPIEKFAIGISLTSDAPTGERNRVTNNLIEDCAVGIQVGNGEADLSNNTIQQASTAGMEIDGENINLDCGGAQIIDSKTGVLISSGSNHTINGCKILNNDDQGLVINTTGSDILVKNSTITNNGDDLVVQNGTNITITSNSLGGDDSDNALLVTGGTIALANKNGIGAAKYGVHVSGGTITDFDENRIQRTTSVGVLVDGGTITNFGSSTEGNEISSNNKFGLQLQSGSIGTIAHNLFTKNEQGVVIDSGSPTLEENEIHTNYEEGIVINGGTPTLQQNSIKDNTDAGVKVNGGTATLTKNRIEANDKYGVEISAGTVNMDYNYFRLNQSYAVKGSAGSGTVSGNLFENNNREDSDRDDYTQTDDAGRTWTGNYFYNVEDEDSDADATADDLDYAVQRSGANKDTSPLITSAVATGAPGAGVGTTYITYSAPAALATFIEAVNHSASRSVKLYYDIDTTGGSTFDEWKAGGSATFAKSGSIALSTTTTGKYCVSMIAMDGTNRNEETLPSVGTCELTFTIDTVTSSSTAAATVGFTDVPSVDYGPAGVHASAVPSGGKSATASSGGGGGGSDYYGTPTRTPTGVATATATRTPDYDLGANTTCYYNNDRGVNYAQGFEAEWVAQRQPSSHEGSNDDGDEYFDVKPGDTVSFWAQLKNIGTRPWVASTHFKATEHNEFTFATYKDPNVISAPSWTGYDDCPGENCGKSYFHHTSWVSIFRIGTLDDQVVYPKQTGRVEMTFKIPADAPEGRFREDISAASGDCWIYNSVNGDPLEVMHIWVGFDISK